MNVSWLKLRRLICLTAIVVASHARSDTLLSPGQYSYNLKADWSDAANPNGAWSYNHSGTPIGTHQMFWWGQAGWGYSQLGDGAILKGNQPTGIDPWGNPIQPAHDWQPGDVMLHALSIPYGGQSTFLNVKWTSPAAGTIDISGRAWEGEIFADRDVSWILSVEGQTIAQRSSVQGLFRTDAGAQFGANSIGGNLLTGIPVDEGDVVEFRVLTQTYYGHFVGLEQNITLTVVPEPGVASLIGLGVVGLSLARFRRRQA